MSQVSWILIDTGVGIQGTFPSDHQGSVMSSTVGDGGCAASSDSVWMTPKASYDTPKRTWKVGEDITLLAIWALYGQPDANCNV